MRVVFAAVVVLASACGGHPPIPTRGVIEGDLGSWKFRRFQGPLLDVEVWVEGNTAEAYSASYITAAAEQRGRIEDSDLVNVFVTRFEKPDGVIRATVKLARRLAQDGGYQVEEDKIAGARTLMITGRGEAWVMWPSSQYVVKLGGRGRTGVPSAMVESYVDRYPSQLPGGALEGALPPGPEEAPAKPADKPSYDSTNPQPDIEHYDPGKVKLPDAAAPGDVGGSGGDKPTEAAAKPAKPAPATKPKAKAKPRPRAK